MATTHLSSRHYSKFFFLYYTFGKMMFLEIVQKIESVVELFFFTNVLVHITLDLVVYGIGWIRKKKGTRYPSECHH